MAWILIKQMLLLLVRSGVAIIIYYYPLLIYSGITLLTQFLIMEGSIGKIMGKHYTNELNLCVCDTEDRCEVGGWGGGSRM